MNELEVKKDKPKELVYNIDDEFIDEEPYDDRYFVNDGNKVELIKYFEKIVRSSFEYSWFIDTLKRTLDVKSCVFFKGYSVDNGMKLEFHHHPFTLFDYTDAVVSKLLDQCEDEEEPFVYEMQVAKEVAMLHYKFMVGLVPLDPTSHQQVHDGVLDIHPDLIIGNYERFYKEYEKYIPEHTKTKYTEWLTTNHNVELEVPKNYKYKPTVINASNKNVLTIEKLDKLLIEDRLSKINNEDISKLLMSN
jgi:hypothetical protein